MSYVNPSKNPTRQMVAEHHPCYLSPLTICHGLGRMSRVTPCTAATIPVPSIRCATATCPPHLRSSLMTASLSRLNAVHSNDDTVHPCLAARWTSHLWLFSPTIGLS